MVDLRQTMGEAKLYPDKVSGVRTCPLKRKMHDCSISSNHQSDDWGPRGQG